MSIVMVVCHVSDIMEDLTISSSSGASGDSPRRKVALITGITGQDGSYLAEFLLEKGYEVSHVLGLGKK